MQTLIDKSQKLELAMTVASAAAGEHDADAALLEHSCTKLFSSRLACQKDFVGAWCQFHSDNISSKMEALSTSCKGLCVSGDTPWKEDVPTDADLDTLLAIAGPKIDSIDGAIVASESQDLKDVTRPCSCFRDATLPCTCFYCSEF